MPPQHPTTAAPAGDVRSRTPVIDVVVPVHDEEADLEP
jgi:hypothetical protein